MDLEQVKDLEKGDLIRFKLEGRTQRGQYVYEGLSDENGEVFIMLRRNRDASGRYYPIKEVELKTR